MIPNTHYALYLLLLLLAACSPPSAQTTTVEQGTTKKPNVIYILADDLGYGDLSCYGQTKFQTPNIDRLAAQGIRFTQHYAGSTVCAPSRSALMTGQHTGHTFVRGNKEHGPEGQYPLPDSIQTLPELLSQAGYVTGAFGKWGLGYPGSEGDPNNQGLDEFFGYNCQRFAHHYYPRHVWHNQDSVVLETNQGQQKGTYAPSLIQDQLLSFLEENQDTSFFLFVPHVIPHAELTAPAAYMERYRDKFLPEKSFQGYDEGPKYREGNYESQAAAHAAFAAMVAVLDDHVGQIMDKLDELGLAENTLVIFTSDNGPHEEGGADPEYFNSNGPLRGIKRDLYEGGVRVPMIARWPGTIAPQQETDHISAFWDVLPTLAELTETPAPSNIDGISFLPTLLGEGEQPQHDYLYWEFHEKGGRVAVRKGPWKAVRYNVDEAPDGPLELYYLPDDIGENNNVADHHPEVVAEMEEILQQAHTPSEVFAFQNE